MKCWWIAVLFLISLLTSCLHSAHDDIKIHPKPEDDPQYFEAFNKSTVHHEVISHFETKFIIQSTLLSLDFRKALTSRYKTLYNVEEALLSANSSKTGFFISVYTANREINDLSDKNIWSIYLKQGNNKLFPSNIELLRNKYRWKPFFKGITPWSKEFLVIFDAPPPPAKNHELMISQSSQLILSNQDARITIDL